MWDDFFLEKRCFATLRREHPEANASNGLPVLDQGQVLVLRVEHQPRDVLLGHPRQQVIKTIALQRISMSISFHFKFCKIFYCMSQVL